MSEARAIAGRYHLEQAIAAGGMGSVWRAHDATLDTKVAVKLMAKAIADDPALRARFELEAKSAARLRCAQVAQTFDYGIDDGVPFLVMELLTGEDLAARLRKEKVLALGEVVRIGREICKGLHRAHAEGIVHRDLKPANIFLTVFEDEPVKILDFGIAKVSGIAVRDGEATKAGLVLGSPHYMSPEQSRGLAVDARSDLWSVAIMLYRALTGRRLFAGDDFGDVIVRISTEPIPPISSVRQGLPHAFDAFFERALCRDPAGRFQNAREFGDALLAAASKAKDDPVTPWTGTLANTRAPLAEVQTATGISAPVALDARPKRRLIVGGLAAAGLLAVGIFVAFRVTRPTTDATALASAPPSSTAATSASAEEQPTITIVSAAEPSWSAAPSSSSPAGSSAAPHPAAIRPARAPSAKPLPPPPTAAARDLGY